MKKHLSMLIVIILLLIVGATTVYGVTDTSSLHLKYNSESLYRGKSLKNKLIGASGTVKWSSSNKKIATVSKKGVIKAKAFGKCTITAKSKGKTYKCRIKVIARKPNFDAKIVAVKNNKTIKVRFYNYSGRSLIILQKAYYKDYTSEKYLFRLKNTQIKIPSYKTKTLTFYNYGSKELWNFAGRQDPDIFAEALESEFYYKFEFDGKKHSGKTYWYYEEDPDTNQWTDYYESVYGDDIPTDAELR